MDYSSLIKPLFLLILNKGWIFSDSNIDDQTSISLVYFGNFDSYWKDFLILNRNIGFKNAISNKDL